MNFTQAPPPQPPTLPSGWTAHWDKQRQIFYYHATSNGVSTWVKPEQPPPPPNDPPMSTTQHPKQVHPNATPNVKPGATTTAPTTQNPEQVYDSSRHILIADRSGSMRSFGSETLGALNAYLTSINTKYPETKVTLITFDNQIDVAATNASPTLKIDPSWIAPRGSTALRDALAQGIAVADKEEAAGKAVGNNVEIFVTLFTDGHDNQSNTSAAQLSEIIRVRKEKGWDFTFLAANQDAITAASALNISGKDAITVGKNRGGMSRAMGSAARKCKRSGFSKSDRSSAMSGFS
jgi:hypothetical protein